MINELEGIRIETVVTKFEVLAQYRLLHSSRNIAMAIKSRRMRLIRIERCGWI
jgi:hypothetical protein